LYGLAIRFSNIR